MRRPKLCRQREKTRADRAFIRLHGRKRFLGEWGSVAAQKAYESVCAEIAACGTSVVVHRTDVRSFDLMDAYLSFARGYYAQSPKEIDHVKRLIKRWNELYEDVEVDDIGPRRLKVWRDHLIRKYKLARPTVNESVNRLRRIVRWGVEEEIVPAAVSQALDAVAPLRKGRSAAREGIKRRPVPEDHVYKVFPFLSRQIRTVIELELLTATRPGEVLSMRPIDIDTTGDCWIYTPEHHKNEWRDHDRTILLGPRCQALIKPFLIDRAVNKPLFSPAEAEADRRKALFLKRKTPMSCGNRAGTNRKAEPELSPGERYTADSYRRAVERACKAAGVPVWTPYQLRHAGTQRLLKKVGNRDAVRETIGWSSDGMIDNYSQRNLDVAIATMMKHG